MLELIRHFGVSASSLVSEFARKARQFVLHDGFLLRKDYTQEGALFLLVIPSHKQKELVWSLRGDLTAGHLRFFKTYHRVDRSYFWPKLHTAVFKNVTSYQKCQRRKAPCSTTARLLEPLPCFSRPFEGVGIYLFDPLFICILRNRSH